MIPSEFTCRRVEALQSTLRLGSTSHGRSVDLIRLVPAAKVQGAFLEMLKYGGKVYGSPYDSNALVPMMIQTIPEVELANGSYIGTIKRWLTPLVERRAEGAEKVKKEVNQFSQDAVEEAVDKRMHELKNTDYRPDKPAYKSLSKEEKAILAGDVEETVGDVIAAEMPK